MNIYSPKPIEDYRDRHGSYTQMLTEDMGAWNLIWLSMPTVDLLLDTTVPLKEFTAQFNSQAAGSLIALAAFFTEDGKSISSLMGPSPVAFAQDLQDRYDLAESKCWTFLGGQVWIDTMMARAYESEGKSDIFQAAKQSANVIIADFGLKRRV
jgi:hypothetical protein